MLTHPTHERLVALGLTGMAKALDEQRQQPDVAALAFEERLGLLVDRETIERDNKRLVSRLKFAGLRQDAAIEDLDTKAVRGLDRRHGERPRPLGIVGETPLLEQRGVRVDAEAQPPVSIHHRPQALAEGDHARAARARA